MLGLAAAWTGSLFGTAIFPQNAALDRYTIIPPLGTIRSIATSTVAVFAVSDDYVLVFDKNTMDLERTYAFDTEIDLIAYDQWFDDLWIASATGLFRLNLTSGMTREYNISKHTRALGVGIEYLYLETDDRLKFRFNRTTGAMQPVGSFPADLRWYRPSSQQDVRKYPLLNPFYYTDELVVSQTPFVRFPITALYDDGTDLYVGTKGFGLLKYSTITWAKQRVIYGPVDPSIQRAARIGNDIYLLSPGGISIISVTGAVETGTWHWGYLRTLHEISTLVKINDQLIVGTGSQLASLTGTLVFPITEFQSNILSITVDQSHLYIGTSDGMFGLIADTREPYEFGPDRLPVYAVHATADYIYAGGEMALYRFDRRVEKWSKILNYGIKDIVQVKDELYLLSVNNQLMSYHEPKIDSLPGDSAASWTLLPYFNVYDIDADSEVLYCASYAGIAYYDPADKLYKTIYNLPRIPFTAVYILDSEILAVSSQGIYRLSTRLRD
jgi:hypothetical protein